MSETQFASDVRELMGAISRAIAGCDEVLNNDAGAASLERVKQITREVESALGLGERVCGNSTISEASRVWLATFMLELNRAHLLLKAAQYSLMQ